MHLVSPFYFHTSHFLFPVLSLSVSLSLRFLPCHEIVRFRRFCLISCFGSLFVSVSPLLPTSFFTFFSFSVTVYKFASKQAVRVCSLFPSSFSYVLPALWSAKMTETSVIFKPSNPESYLAACVEPLVSVLGSCLREHGSFALRMREPRDVFCINCFTS